MDRNLQGSVGEDSFEVTHGNHFHYFCPKRFNRYPRFTIFFKRDQQNQLQHFANENTVSLTPQFLSYLMNRRSAKGLDDLQDPNMEAHLAESLKTNVQKIPTDANTIDN